MKNASEVYPEIDVSELCIDYMLYSEPNEQPSMEEVCAFFARGEWYEEHYCVAAIEKYLQTEEQRKVLYDNRLTIEKILNGHYPVCKKGIVTPIFEAWNEKLGFRYFG